MAPKATANSRELCTRMEKGRGREREGGCKRKSFSGGCQTSVQTNGRHVPTIMDRDLDGAQAQADNQNPFESEMNEINMTLAAPHTPCTPCTHREWGKCQGF